MGLIEWIDKHLWHIHDWVGTDVGYDSIDYHNYESYQCRKCGKFRHHRKILAILCVLTMARVVSANYTENYFGRGADLYWVPSNTILFHLNFPWDLVLLGFATIGIVYVLHLVWCILWDWWDDLL